MSDQPTQADRERALAMTRYCLEVNVRPSPEGGKLAGRVLLALHAENERLWERVANIPFALGGRVPAELSERLVAGILEPDEAQTQEPKVEEAPADDWDESQACWCSDRTTGGVPCPVGKCPNAPKPETQAETWPSDEELQAEYERVEEETLANRVALARANPKTWGSNSLGEMCRRAARRATYAAGYQAGRASLAGELELMRQERDEYRDKMAVAQMATRGCQADLEAEKAARLARVMPSLSAEAIDRAIIEAGDEYQRLTGEPWMFPFKARIIAICRLLAPTQDSGPVGSADRDVASVAATGSSPEAAAQPTGASSDPPDRYVPSVGERAVLVASPDRIDRDLVGEHVDICGKDTSSVDSYWKVAAFGAYGTNREVHRDATWRRAQPQGEVTTDVEANATNGGAPEQRGHTFKMRVTGGARGYVPGTLPGDPPESDAAWLKRTVEELTTARPVEVTPCDSGAFAVVTPDRGCQSMMLRGSVIERDADMVAQCLRDAGWPIRRHARPVEPAADPIEALSKRVVVVASDLHTLSGLADDRFAAAENRLDELELQGRVIRRKLTGEYPAAMHEGTTRDVMDRIEREERAK